MLTRRTATVTISAPAASCAWAMTAKDEYLPVPTISRDVNVRPAMTSGSGVAMGLVLLSETPPGLATTDEVDDLDLVALADHGRVEHRTPHNDEVVLDRDATGVDRQHREQGRNGHRTV